MIWVLAWAIPAGLAIGMSLGALGGGGSVLTVPALVYLLHQNAHAATTASLIIVGLTAAAGAAGHWRAGRVKVAEGTVFGLLGVAGSYAGSRASAAVSQHVLLAAFAGLMVIAAGAMLRGRSAPAARPSPPAARGAASGAGVAAGRASAVPPARRAARGGLPGPADGSGTAWRVRDGLRVAGAATVVGLLTGFFGVGGGFVIVPALVLALGFGMATAVGTSLLVIAISSAAALAARAGSGFGLDWALVAAFSGAAIAGTLAGKRIADRVTGRALTVAFACLLAALASYMLARSLPALA
ncbi:MAG TPA: sulfite exporter TauE/SafE family protein [Streptosporangiaceae bacterium]|nr:sulfite exporter TauE/SafE family protein [Streptosporangiaceae bacterium]